MDNKKNVQKDYRVPEPSGMPNPSSGGK